MENKYNFNAPITNAFIGNTINSENFIVNQNNNSADSLSQDLLLDLVDKAQRMVERKHTKQIEDLHNDSFTDFLRDKGYIATDQTRSGKSFSTSGELDIMIRKENGTPISIIEAFRLSSCGQDNKIVSEHLNKLLHNYDTIGLKRNFVIVYAEAKKFNELWTKYCEYINELNTKKEFSGKHILKSFKDTEIEFSKVTDVKVGYAIHDRENNDIELFHIFINLFID